jgi:hypothetical protein
MALPLLILYQIERFMYCVKREFFKVRLNTGHKLSFNLTN